MTNTSETTSSSLLFSRTASLYQKVAVVALVAALFALVFGILTFAIGLNNNRKFEYIERSIMTNTVSISNAVRALGSPLSAHLYSAAGSTTSLTTTPTRLTISSPALRAGTSALWAANAAGLEAVTSVPSGMSFAVSLNATVAASGGPPPANTRVSAELRRDGDIATAVAARAEFASATVGSTVSLSATAIFVGPAPGAAYELYLSADNNVQVDVKDVSIVAVYLHR